MDETPVRIIKKYANRRLYDTEQSAYITLDGVRDLVTNRIPFQVVDNRTGADLTRLILLQIISEQEDKGHPVFDSNT
ncbi:MAG: polyhydroxyalkanoate synthesis regulator DNA-binding domain-containing protein, partial [Magnetococcales bacterium]|nr:polyhydroxyalkanoate synthesis regulator DNA-binding domain-containing protein [Magnetococcales bacterium]